MKLAPLFDERLIAARVKAVAGEIARHPLKPEIAAPILVGAFVFAADLVRELAREGVSLPVEFLWLRSYASARVGAEHVATLVGPGEAIRGKTVLLIDGVLDRGATVVKAREMLMECGAAAVLSAVAVDKQLPDNRIRADFACFTGVHDFIVGYGMDDAGQHRALPYIAKVAD